MSNNDPIKNRLEELLSSSEGSIDLYRDETGEFSPITIQAEQEQYSADDKSSQLLLEKRVRELDCLNEIGFRIDEKPPITEFLSWVSRLIPSALFHPEIATAAIEYQGKIFGDQDAVQLSSKIVAGIRIANELAGYIHVAYREPKHFMDEESAFLGAVTDRITGYLENQHLFEQMENRSEELIKFKKGIDLTTDAVFITDPDGKITYTNKSFEQVYGFSQSEAIGNTPRIIKSGHIQQEQYKHFWRSLLSGEIVSGEFINKSKNGRIIPVEGANIPILDDQNVIVGFLAIHRDISSQKQDKKLLTKRAADLEAVAQLSTTISAILEPDRLLQTVVDLSKEMLNLYHTHIYLLDPLERVLTLASGSGDAGRRMVNDNWKIDLDNEASIVANTAREQQGIIINDVQNEISFLKHPLLPNTKSELAVPIIVGEKVLGVLDVQSDEIENFTPEDVSIHTALAGQIAVALQNARQYQETQSALAHSEALLLVSQTSAGSLESSEILSQALIKILNVTGYDSGLISLLNPGTNRLELANQYNLPDRILAALVTDGFDETLCDYVFRNNETLFLEDINLGAPLAVSGLVALGFHAYYGVPLRSREETIGTLCLFGKKPQTRQAQTDKLLQAAGRQIGVAYGNSLLFERTQTALAQTEALYQGSQSVIQAKSPQALLEAVVESTPANKFDHAYLMTFGSTWEDSPPESVVISAVWVSDNSSSTLLVREIYSPKQLGFDTLINSHEPVFIYDIHNDERVNQNILTVFGEDLGSQSLAVFPLVVQGQFIGAITILSTETVELTGVEIRQIFSLARQSGIVLHSLQLRKNLETQLSEMEVLQGMLSREAWTTYLSQSDSRNWGYVFDQFETRPISSPHQRKSDNGNGHIDPPIAPNQFQTFTTPLEVRGERIGGLGIQTQEEHNITEDEENFLRSVAEQVSQALERARLIEQTQKTALELQTVAQVSSTSATVLDPGELLQSVVDLAKNSFGMYHAHIYLLDKDETQLVLTSGAGEVGRQMVDEGWVIFVDDDSIVARTATKRQGQIVNDVRGNPDFLPNPLLPNTAAELAVPMVVGSKLLGVFDIQSDRPNSFSENDLQTYTTLAAQTAVALQNARLFEEQSITVERLRELDHLKTSFLANMSHELRTPLNSILGFTQVILEGIDGPLTDYMVSDLQLIEKNGKHLLRLINEVLDMAKIESGRMSLTIETVDLHELLNEVLETTSAQARDKSIYLDLETTSEDDLIINADLIRIKQVMLNLIGNSIKFTESGSVTIKAEKQSDEVLIQVVDTGIGIPPDKLESIFEAFSQVDTSTTRKAGGTGLGLPISRRLVEMHGGKLWAESDGSGKGTIMQVTLPVHPALD